MFKRALWLTVGAGFGFGISFWLVRVLRSTVERYTPERVSADRSGALRRFGADVKEAAAEGRAAMREREDELRRELGPDRNPPR